MPNQFRHLFLSCLILLGVNGLSQSFTDDLRISGNYHYGLVVPEYNNFTYLVEKNTQAFELTASKQTTGKNIWEKLYNYPSFGISAYYSTLGNDRVHGREFAIVPFAVFHYLKTDRFHIDQEIGIGFGYVTKCFDPQTNFENVAVGSHLNCHFTMRLGMHYQFTPKFDFGTGIGFSHFSNGNLQEPNEGINVVGLYAGISYLIGKASEKELGEIEPYKKDHVFDFVYSFGGKHTRSLQSNIYMTSSIALEYKYFASRAFHMGIGTDLFYDSSTKIEMQTTNPIPYEKSYAWSSGIHISQELIYNQISLIVQEGIYVGLTDKINGHHIYNRGIIKYNLSDRFFVSMAMKTHLHILDYPELGIGINWK